MKRLTALQKFKKFYNSLSFEHRRDLYFIFAAIRGPDTGSGVAKEHGAAIVRVAALGANNDFGEINEDFEEFRTSLGPEHYRFHMVRAQEAFQRQGVYLGK